MARDPRAEANAMLADGHEARVLEPSPPADTTAGVFADDPTDPTGGEGIVVSPTPDADLTWDTYLVEHPDVAPFAREHWLGDLDRLADLPDSYVETREGLHQLAFSAVAPMRHAANGKIGLRYTHRGFGTPYFADDTQVRVVGDRLLLDGPDGERSVAITTVRDATEWLGLPYREDWFDGWHDPLTLVDPDVTLAVDATSSLALGRFYGFATHALEIARRQPGAIDVSRVQLWPEHFDPAFEMGSADAGERASYGASPGDASMPQPYLYVSAWGDVDRSVEYFNSESFNGAVLTYRELLDAEDQMATAVDFYRRGHLALTGQG